MAQSLLSILRTSISPYRRKSAQAAEHVNSELLAQHLQHVLGELREQERQLLDLAQRVVEE